MLRRPPPWAKLEGQGQPLLAVRALPTESGVQTDSGLDRGKDPVRLILPRSWKSKGKGVSWGWGKKGVSWLLDVHSTCAPPPLRPTPHRPRHLATPPPGGLREGPGRSSPKQSRCPLRGSGSAPGPAGEPPPGPPPAPSRGRALRTPSTLGGKGGVVLLRANHRNEGGVVSPLSKIP